MQIKLDKTEDQIALIKAVASKDRDVAYEAKATVAELVGPVISEVINNAPSISSLYTTASFSEDDNLSMPLDLLHDVTDQDYIRVHSQTVAGGLSSNEMFPAQDELKFKTYSLDSAWSFDKKYARKARVDVVSAVFTRMAQEFLLKQEKTSVNQLLGALVAADTKVGGSAAAGNHVISTLADDRLQLADFNALVTRSKRIWSNYSSGTPVGGSMVGVSDLIMSPEAVESIRSIAYNPVSENQSHGTDATDAMREALMGQGGLPSLFGIGIIEILELGVNQRYNEIFDAVNTAAGSPVTFDNTKDEIIIGVDRGNTGLIRPTVTEEGSSTEVTVEVDDQFAVRQNKTGWYGKIEEGRIVTEDRRLSGIVLTGA
jgi:hypothetical protein